MAFRKRFNGSEAAVVVALAELCRGGFLEPCMFEFDAWVVNKPFEVGEVNVDRYVERSVELHYNVPYIGLEIRVRAPIERGFAPKTEEAIHRLKWEPFSATMRSTGYYSPLWRLVRVQDPVLHWARDQHWRR